MIHHCAFQVDRARQLGSYEDEFARFFSCRDEGAKEIEEGIAIRSSDIDVAAVYGFGFPSWRGGPMQYADEVGTGVVAAAVQRFHDAQGYWWQPSKLLLELARNERKFAD